MSFSSFLSGLVGSLLRQLDQSPDRRYPAFSPIPASSSKVVDDRYRHRARDVRRTGPQQRYRSSR